MCPSWRNALNDMGRKGSSAMEEWLIYCKAVKDKAECGQDVLLCFNHTQILFSRVSHGHLTVQYAWLLNEGRR